MALKKAVSSTITLDGEVALDLRDPAVRGLMSFSANAGQWLALTIREQGDGISGLKISVFAPDGSSLNGSALLYPPAQATSIYADPVFSVACNVPGGTVGCHGNAIINIGPIPANKAGTYTVLVEQTGGTGGYLHFIFTSPTLTSGLSANDGQHTWVVGNSGKGLLIPFNAELGKQYILWIEEAHSDIPALGAFIVDAQGNTVAGAGYLIATCTDPCGLGDYSGSDNSGFGVKQTGNYRILVQQITQTKGTNDYGPLWGALKFTLTSP